MDALNHIVVAQLQPLGKVRAVVIGIGPKPWAFTPARAAAQCRKAFPGKSPEELNELASELQTLAEAAVAPIRDTLGIAPVKQRKPSVADLKRKLRRHTLPLPGGLGNGFLGRLR
ncbi:hypothetical protein AOT14_23650 [Stenotrophomonas acidaminiphila]|uniref:Uncharacterized protein n=1 Tax=Stenotrophomonas acidaminiphila TaxID=128780 RepID=A0A0S1B0X8_9GAMM|nr:hypothetical protein [Stenotrophomonas acidaminiphila]ALJ28732.1 hypothetical protein AOT14_23650 [Stenotrophomonas acidaminiphila]